MLQIGWSSRVNDGAQMTSVGAPTAFCSLVGRDE